MNINLRFNSTGRRGAIFLSVLMVAMMAMPVLDGYYGNPVQASMDLNVMVDNTEIDYGDAPPLVQDGRTYVGVRSLALALGVPESQIQWDEPTRSASLTKNSTIVILTLGSNIMQVNNDSVYMDAIPFANNSRAYLPVRYLAEAFGFTVNYDEINNRALLTSPDAVDNNSSDVNTSDINSQPQYMEEVLQPFAVKELYYWENEFPFMLAGQKYFHGYKFIGGCITQKDSGSFSFNLQGKYSSIAGLMGISDTDAGFSAHVEVLGSGNSLGVYELVPGEMPQEVEWDVTGVEQLTFKTSIYDNQYNAQNCGIELADFLIQ